MSCLPLGLAQSRKMKAREEKLLSQPLSHEEAGTPGLGEDLALSFKTSKCQPPLRAEEAEGKWGGGKPGMIRATGAVGIRTVGLGVPLCRPKRRGWTRAPHPSTTPPASISPGSTRQLHSRTRGLMVGAGHADTREHSPGTGNSSPGQGL